MIVTPFIALRYARNEEGKFMLTEDLFSKRIDEIPTTLNLTKPRRPDFMQRYEHVLERDVLNDNEEKVFSGLSQTLIRNVFYGDVRVKTGETEVKRMLLFIFSEDGSSFELRFYPNNKPTKDLARKEGVKTLTT
jgi:hypothetical protein